MSQQPTGFRAIEIFRDPSPGGLINLRYLKRMMELATLTDLRSEELQQFKNVILLVSKKLAAVWKHFEAYTIAQKGLVEEAKGAKPVSEQQVVSYSQDLFLEFDEFLVQTKSALDYLMRVPLPIMGRAWTIRLFGKRGKTVLAALRKNMPDEWKVKANWLADTLLAVHLEWLEASIQGRDMMNHCLDGGIEFEAFIVCKTTKDGEEYIHVPQMEDHLTIHNIMEITWINLFSLIEDFTAGFLAFRIKPEFVLSRYIPQPYSPESPWNAMRRENFEKVKQNPDVQKL
jgi:hypothetical protein